MSDPTQNCNCSDESHPNFVSSYVREMTDRKDEKGFTLMLTPWTVQNIALEMVANHFLNNDPIANGYHFKQKFDSDKMKSEVFLDIAYHWDAKVIGQRPAIFVQRDSSRTASPVINQTIGMNVANSEKTKLNLNYMNIGIACIATNLGFVEELADFVKQPFLYYQEQIREDFRFRRFRLEDISRPQIYLEAKDHFIVMLTIATVFDERWTITGDDLKIKTISKTIFDKLSDQPLLNQ